MPRSTPSWLWGQVALGLASSHPLRLSQTTSHPKAYLHVLVPSSRFSCYKDMSFHRFWIHHFYPGFCLSGTGALHGACKRFMATTISMLWYLASVPSVPGSISPGTDRGSDFFSLVTERQENQQDVLLFQRCSPHSPHKFSPTSPTFMMDNRLCFAVPRIPSFFICVLSFFVSSQVSCCGFALTSAIAFTAVISSAIHPLKEQIYTFFLFFSSSIGFLAVEALLKPHITNWINSPKPLRHNFSIQKKPAHKKTDSPPVKQATTLPKQKDEPNKKT